MTETNRMRLAGVKEATLGVTPNSPRMRRMAFLSEGLRYVPVAVASEAVREDRMQADDIKVGEDGGGTLSLELIYPAPGTLLSSVLESAFCNAWAQTPERDNDGVADSVITDVLAASQTVTVANGPGFVAGHMVRHSGFGQAANNGLFRVSTGGATSYACTGAGLVNEPVPAAGARVKVVGMQGASGDISATATGLASSAASFTAAGLTAGQWIKIGAGAPGGAFRFGTEANNGYARITSATANALTLDHLPPGWAVDSGAGKTITIWFGDRLWNGTTEVGLTLERGFMAQATPTYIVNRGMVVDSLALNIAARQKVTMEVQFRGMGGGEGTVPLSATPDAAPNPAAFPVFAAGAHVGRVMEATQALTGPNWCQSFKLTLGNNLRPVLAVDSLAAADIGTGALNVTAELNTYFGDRRLLTKMLAMTPTLAACTLTQGTRALVWAVPRGVPQPSQPNAPGGNQDAMMPFTLAGRFADLGYAVSLDRFEYVEA